MDGTEPQEYLDFLATLDFQDDIGIEAKSVFYGNEKTPASQHGWIFRLPEGGEQERLVEQMKKTAWNWKQPRQCVICGKEFIPKSIRHRCCSAKCWYKKRYRTREYHGSTQLRTCEWCGKEFIDIGSWGRKHPKRFCSLQCLGKAHAYQLIQEGRCGYQVTGREMARRSHEAYLRRKKEKENAGE